MSFGGPGSAFSFAAPTRPSRRTGSYSSSVGGGKDSNSTATSPSHTNGPTPVDPPANPSHGSWSNGATSPRQREDSNNSTSGSSPTTTAPRSFSSILSPSLTANGAHDGDYVNGTGEGGNRGGFGGGKVKPFVYSRDFLLSLYDDEKAKKRPLELAVHEMATRDLSGSDAPQCKPWALQDYREGEKDVSLNSSHCILTGQAHPGTLSMRSSSRLRSTPRTLVLLA